MASLPKLPLTAAEYLALERAAEVRGEFIDGQVFAMSGGTRAHAAIIADIIAILTARLRGSGCQVFPSDLRVAIENRAYLYPDASVVCGEPRFEDEREDNLLNPALVIEVLSPSTERFDRMRKATLYRTIPSLTEYLLVSQDTVFVEHFVRQPGGQWAYSAYAELDSVVPLTAAVELPLREVYRRAPGGSNDTA